jgi:hypothetical protein
MWAVDRVDKGPLLHQKRSKAVQLLAAGLAKLGWLKPPEPLNPHAAMALCGDSSNSYGPCLPSCLVQGESAVMLAYPYFVPLPAEGQQKFWRIPVLSDAQDFCHGVGEKNVEGEDPSVNGVKAIFHHESSMGGKAGFDSPAAPMAVSFQVFTWFADRKW